MADPQSCENKVKAVSTIEAIRERKRDPPKAFAATKKRGPKKKPQSDPARAFIRQFRHPDTVHLSAQEYQDFLDWRESRTWHEPPFTEGCSDEVLKAHINDWNALILPRIPGIAQEVERHIKIITKVSKVKKTHEGRHSRILKLPKI